MTKFGAVRKQKQAKQSEIKQNKTHTNIFD
jgi:hypothetical protein